jgi:hypothetical protein
MRTLLDLHGAVKEGAVHRTRPKIMIALNLVSRTGAETGVGP